MFKRKRKCHEYGDAVKVYGEIILLCYCLAPSDAEKLIKHGKYLQVKECDNV